MKEHLKKFIKQSILLTSLVYILYNIRIRLKWVFNRIGSISGTTHSAIPLEDSIKYIEDVFFDYKRVSGRGKFQGVMAEIGPGDNAGVAMMFLGDGVKRADLADRFYSSRDHLRQKSIYDALLKKYPTIRESLGEDLDFSQDIEIPGIHRYYGRRATGEVFFEENQGYDYIISRSVLEHVDDPALVLRKMFAALNSGGMLIHKVDLRDHGMLTPHNVSTRFLEIPGWVYKLMTKGSGYPNRFLFHRYRQILEELSSSTRFYVTGLHGVEPLAREYEMGQTPSEIKDRSLQFIEGQRPKFAREFHDVSSEDLMVSSFFFVCEKR